MVVERKERWEGGNQGAVFKAKKIEVQKSPGPNHQNSSKKTWPRGYCHLQDIIWLTIEQEAAPCCVQMLGFVDYMIFGLNCTRLHHGEVGYIPLSRENRDTNHNLLGPR